MYDICIFATCRLKTTNKSPKFIFAFMCFLKLEIPSFPMISNTCSLLKYNQVKYHVRVRAINDIPCRKTCFSCHLLCCSFCDLLVVLSRRVTYLMMIYHKKGKFITVILLDILCVIDKGNNDDDS